MFDINFYMKIHNVIKNIENIDKEYIRDFFEDCRSKDPIVYNIETTNACNMKCGMCPRTTKMTRKVKTLDKESFINIINQLQPISPKEWVRWCEFVKNEYDIDEKDMSENHFFLYIIPQVIQLHGYGDPLLDKNMSEYISLLNKKGFKSYFSCNPSNINMNKTLEMFDNGLDYIKYSIESTNDQIHKQLRGAASDFTESYKKICKLLELIDKYNYNTTVVITMLNLNRINQMEDYEALENLFKDLNVYLYLKSEDQQWYRKDFHGTNSIHWSEICKHPWMSMTIKSNGDVAMCMEDYNNEIVLGNIYEQTLYDIWNGKLYSKFRDDHIDYNANIKCAQECDMKMIGELLRGI